MQQTKFRFESASGEFCVPWSTGYQTYSGFLSTVDSVGAGDVATKIHETDFSGLSNSGLIGNRWGEAERNYHHTVLPAGEATYELQLGIIHPEDRAVYEALIKAFVIEDRNLPLAHGELSAVEVSTDRVTHSELLERSAEIADSATGVRMRFISPTCRQRYGDVWEVTPDRTALFTHLLDRWNLSAPDESDVELSIDSQTIGESVYPQVDKDTYQTNTMVVYRGEQSADSTGSDGSEAVASDGGRRQAQGFMGDWEYRFKDASKSTRTAILTLAQFAEFAGVGHFTSRGGGAVETEVLGV